MSRDNETDGADGAAAPVGMERRFTRRLRPSGGYRDLHSFQAATVIYDATVAFCERFVDGHSRTRDQMVQAARSGRQNIAEGSRASATSSQTELRLINVARASLDELLLDYEDYLRQHGQAQWAKDSGEALAVRRVGRRLARRVDGADRTDPADPPDQANLYRPWLDSDDATVIANAVSCLIHQANYLLDQQGRALERQFVTQGGYSEQLAAVRLQERERQAGRNRKNPSDPSDRAQAPLCPLCGSPMALRTARKGPRAGSQFWGCAKFSACKATRHA